MMPRAFPFIDWLFIRPGQLRVDAIAGATVAVVAIPQALAYAQLAGVPAHLGLYAAFVPTIVAALWGSCAQLSTGPVALTALLTAASIAPLAPAGSAQFAALAVLLALMSGALQWLAGLSNAGALVDKVPESVIAGFVNAAGVMIILAQLPTLVGVSGPVAPNVIHSVRALADNVHAWHLPTALFGAVSMVAMIALRSRWPALPGALIVMGVAAAASSLTGFGLAGGAVVGDLPAGLPSLSMPVVETDQLIALLPAALAIALVSFIEVLSSCRTITSRTGAPWHVNQELVGQGMAKVASALFGAFPVSGSFSRSALTYEYRARTAWASIVCAALVAVALMVATGALHHLPKAVLAAVIMLAISTLLSPMQLVRMWRGDRGRGLTALITFAATLASAPAIHLGLAVGLAVSLLTGFWSARRGP